MKRLTCMALCLVMIVSLCVTSLPVYAEDTAATPYAPTTADDGTLTYEMNVTDTTKNISLTFTVPETNFYTTTVNAPISPSAGECVFRMDDCVMSKYNTGSGAYDLYSAEEGELSIELPKIYLTAGTHTLKLSYDGKNTLSSGRTVGINTLTLTPVTEDTLWYEVYEDEYNGLSAGMYVMIPKGAMEFGENEAFGVLYTYDPSDSELMKAGAECLTISNYFQDIHGGFGARHGIRITPLLMNVEITAQIGIITTQFPHTMITPIATETFVPAERLAEQAQNGTTASGAEEQTASQTLVANALAFSEALQKFVGNNTSATTESLKALAEAGIANSKTEIAKPAEDYVHSPAANAAAKLYAAGVRFGDETQMYFKFDSTGDALPTVTINGTACDPDKIEKLGDGKYIVYTDNIIPADFDENFTVELTDASGNVLDKLEKYSVNAYVYAMKDNDRMSDLAKALYNYGLAAENLAK